MENVGGGCSVVVVDAGDAGDFSRWGSWLHAAGGGAAVFFDLNSLPRPHILVCN